MSVRTTAAATLALVLCSVLAAPLSAGAVVEQGAARASTAPTSTTLPAPTVTLGLSATSVPAGKAVTATVTAKRGSALVPGAVAVFVGGVKKVSRAAFTGQGTVTIPASALAVGTQSVHVVVTPVSTSLAAGRSSAQTLTVTRAPSTVTATLKTPSVPKNEQVALHVTAQGLGRLAPGAVEMYVDGVRAYRLEGFDGDATLTVGTRTLTTGSHGVHVRFIPQSTSLAPRSTAPVTFTVTRELSTSGMSPVIVEAKKYLGTPYVWGGTDPSGLDCSGLTTMAYRGVGITLPRSSTQQSTVGTKVSRAAARPGDIIWVPGHVSLYMGNNMQIEAGRGTAVQIRPLWQSSPTFIHVSDKATTPLR